MRANIVHPQPPHPGRSAALMLTSFAAHGLLVWGLVHYSLKPSMQMEFIRTPEPPAIQVMVIETPRSTPSPPPLPSPVQPVVQAKPVAPKAVSVARPQVAQTRPVAQATPQPDTPAQLQAAAPTPAPVQATLAATTPITAPVATSAGADKPRAASTVSTPEKPAEPPLVQGHPDYAYNPLPDYPMALREQGLGGVVWLRVWVDSDGHPGDIKLAKGSGYRLLDESALRAVRSWRFVPAKLGEQRQPSWVEFPVRFASNS